MAKAIQRTSRTGLRWMGGAYRVPYLHYWTLREGTDSLVCFHNVFSILDPDVRRPCGAVLRIHDAAGRALTVARLEVEARGSRMVDVRTLLADRARASDAPCEGSLELDLVPPADFEVRGSDSTDHAVIGAYFNMMYRSPAGMMTTVHAIDRGAVFRGVPAPMGRLLGLRTKTATSAWRSKRLIWADGLREIRTVLINHAGGPRSLHLGLRRNGDGAVVAQIEASVPTRGLIVLDYTPPAGEAARGEAGELLVFSNALATPNGKPYVWVGYGTAPMSVHHG